MPRNRREFTAEFKRDAVELVRTTGRPVAQVAQELGIYDSTLGNWGVSRTRKGPYVGTVVDRGAVQEMKDCRPFGVALWGEASNHLMLRWLKTVVVSDEETAHVMRQVGTGKASASEPLMTCRD